MKIFTQLQNHIKILGINPTQAHLFNATNVLALLLLAYFSGVTLGLIFFEGISVIVLENAFYAAISSILSFCLLSSNILKQKKIFEFIENLENVIENSELFYFEPQF